MTIEQKRKHAGWKAANTRRYQNIANVENFPELLHLAEEIKIAEYAFQADHTRESFIANNIGPTTYQSFVRFGDRNNATHSMILYWIRNDGIPLDEQAMHIGNEYGHEILPEELASFISDNDHGMNAYEPLARIAEMKKAFKEMYGFSYDYSWIKKHLIIEEIAHPTDTMPF